MSINIYCNSINIYYNKNKAVLNLNFKTAFVFNFIKTDCIQSGTEVRFNIMLSIRTSAAYRLLYDCNTNKNQCKSAQTVTSRWGLQVP